jgi:hypothetical protein
LVELNLKFPFFHGRQPIEASHGDIYKVKEETGSIATEYRWTDRRPHPNNMDNYEEWGNDSEASVALEVLKNIIAGVGYHTEMPEDVDETHKNKKVIDEYGENVNLDEDLQLICHTMLHKGFCPVERIENYDLKVLPPETFYIYMDKKGKVLKYTQERTIHDVINEWKTPKEMEDIILFFFGKTTSWPYGKSLLEPIGDLLDERAQMNEDMPKAVHRWAYPIPVISTKGPRKTVQDAFVNRDVDEAVFIGNVMEDEFKLDTLAIDPQARFIPYIELIYYQICEGLHAPLLLYLKNATEASATVMMESVDRLVNGVQRYIKRRVEKYLFEPQVGEPVPRLVWGQPKTGLEEITLTDIAAICPYLDKDQKYHLLKQFIPDLPEPKEEPTPQLPFQPFQKQPEIPMEQILEKLNDVETGLTVIQTNYVEKRISITEAMRLADRTITVHMKRAYPNSWKSHRDAKFEEFAHKLIPIKEGKAFHVTVNE